MQNITGNNVFFNKCCISSLLYTSCSYVLMCNFAFVRYHWVTGKEPLTYYDMNLSAQDHQVMFDGNVFMFDVTIFLRCRIWGGLTVNLIGHVSLRSTVSNTPSLGWYSWRFSTEHFSNCFRLKCSNFWEYPLHKLQSCNIITQMLFKLFQLNKLIKPTKNSFSQKNIHAQTTTEPETVDPNRMWP